MIDGPPDLLNGWNTNPVNYIRVYTPYRPWEVGVSQRHKGVWDPTKYVLRRGGSPGPGAGIDIGNNWHSGTNSIWIDGLQIWLDSGPNDGNSGIITNQGAGRPANHRMSNNIIRGPGATTNMNYGIFFFSAASGSVARIWNNIIYDFSTSNECWGKGSGIKVGWHYYTGGPGPCNAAPTYKFGPSLTSTTTRSTTPIPPSATGIRASRKPSSRRTTSTEATASPGT